MSILERRERVFAVVSALAALGSMAALGAGGLPFVAILPWISLLVLAVAAVLIARGYLSRPLHDAIADLEQRLAVLSSDGEVIFWSGELESRPGLALADWCRYSGQSPQQATGEGWTEAVHPDDRESLRRRWQQQRDSDAPYEHQYRIWHAPSSDWRWILERASRVPARTPDTPRWQGVLIDIDARRRAEDRLRASEERYRILVDRSRDGIWRMEFDPPIPLDLPEDQVVERYYRDGRVVECNDAFARCYGYECGERMLGATNEQMLDRGAPGNLDVVRRLVRAGFDLPSLETLEPAEDGSLRVIEASIAGIERDGLLVGEWGIQRNVTQERAAREELVRHRGLLQTVLDTVPAAITVKDTQGRFLYMNRAVLDLFGWEPGEFVGRTLEDFRQRGAARHLQALDEQVLRHGEPLRNVAVPIDGAAGEECLLLVNESPLRDGDGRLTGVVTCSLDATELERARRELSLSERRWRRVFESAPISMELFDADGEFQEGNPASHDLFGMPRPGLRQINILRDIARLYGSHGVDRLRAGHNLSWDGWYDFEELEQHGYDRRDRGGHAYLRTIVSPITDVSDTLFGYLGICADDTARRRSEEALQASESRYRRFLENSHEGIWRVEFEPPVPMHLPVAERLARYRRDGRLAECNEALARQHGHADSAALLGAADGGPGAWGEPGYAADLLQGDGRVSGTYGQRRHADGATLQLRINAVGEVVDGALVREWGIAQDVGAEMAAEHARDAERARLYAILENVPIGINLKDREARYTFVNRWLCDVWGVSREALLGRRVDELGLVEKADEVLAVEREVIATGKASRDHRGQLTRHDDGSVIEIIARKSALRDEHGAVGGVLTAMLDVTEVERARRELERERTLLQTVLDTAPVHITVKDAQARYTYVNRRARQVSGWGADEIVGRDAGDVDHPLYAAQVLALDRYVLRTGEACLDIEVGGEDPSIGAPRILVLNKSPLRDSEGNVTGLVSCTLDVSAQKAAERELERQRALFESVLDALPIGVSLRDRERRFRYFNHWWRERFGFEAEAVLGHTIAELPQVQDNARMDELDMEVLEHGRPVDDVESPLHAVDGGAERYGLVSKRPLRNAAGELDGIITCTVDITERRRVELALAEGEQRYRLLYDDNPSMFFTVDEQGVLRQVNRCGAEQLGFEADELVGRRFADMHPEGDRELVAAQVANCFAEPDVTHRWEARRLRRDGSTLWVRETARSVTDAHGVRVMLSVCEDISEARNLSQELSWQASHDALTGLVNRREFERRLALALETARGADVSHTLCYLDLDQFKVINDTGGHVAGDELLRQLGVLFGGRIRRQDTLARLGGDEFGVLMMNCELDAAQSVCGGLRATLEEFRFAWDNKMFRVGCSMGLVLLDAEAGSVSEVLSAADAACYAAKDGGGNRIHVYRNDDAELARRRGEMQWVSRIERAMSDDRLSLMYQEITALDGSDPGDHYELLLRMRDEQGDSISPGDFLPAAERYGLATRLDRFVVQRAADWLGGQPERLERLFLCCINLSGLTLAADDFPAYVRETFTTAGVPLNRICFELTETAAIANLARATRFMETLRAEGCLFALDDFGSGFSSFAYLKHLPVDFLKIDGMFVRDIAEDPIDLAMVRSISEIGRVMGKRTIAEFVESEAVLERLRELGVDYGQGYHLGRPRPLEEFGGG